VQAFRLTITTRNYFPSTFHISDTSDSFHHSRFVAARQTGTSARTALPAYLVITPQAMRSPELPAGSVFMSSGFAWMTSEVPPLLKSE
jgi:hypothetical protein